MGFLLGNWKIIAIVIALAISHAWVWNIRGDLCEQEALRQTLKISEDANNKAKELQEKLDEMESRNNREELYDETSKPGYDCIVSAHGVRLLNSEKANYRPDTN